MPAPILLGCLHNFTQLSINVTAVERGMPDQSYGAPHPLTAKGYFFASYCTSAISCVHGCGFLISDLTRHHLRFQENHRITTNWELEISYVGRNLRHCRLEQTRHPLLGQRLSTQVIQKYNSISGTTSCVAGHVWRLAFACSISRFKSSRHSLKIIPE